MRNVLNSNRKSYKKDKPFSSITDLRTAGDALLTMVSSSFMNGCRSLDTPFSVSRACTSSLVNVMEE